MFVRLTDNISRATFGSKISDRIWEDNNGQLICRDAIIARTGAYEYLESELGGDGNGIVKVYRDDNEVFCPTSMTSFENKPLTNEHPSDDVSPESVMSLMKGYMINVRRGDGDLRHCLLADIVVVDPETIRLIKSGEKRELSLGYNTSIVEVDGKNFMTNIRGNHLALVSSGRAGIATIRDSAKKIVGGKMAKSKITLFDDDIIEIEEVEDTGVVGEVELEKETPVMDSSDMVAAQQETNALLRRLIDLMESKSEMIVEDNMVEIEEITDEEVVIEETPEPMVDNDPVIEVDKDGDGHVKEDKIQDTYANFANVASEKKEPGDELQRTSWQNFYDNNKK